MGDYKKWSEVPYPGEQIPPKGFPEAGSWPMFFIIRGSNDSFFNPFQQRIDWNLTNPLQIDWEKEQAFLNGTLKSLTTQQIELANYWGTVESIQRITPLIFSFMEKYRLSSPKSARVLGCFHSAMNDTFIMTWYFKYLWDVARPCQYNQSIKTVVPTPRFPAYPSAHATVAGCTEKLLGHFFPQETNRIKTIMEDSARSRLYAGVHFNVDNDEGLKLGRQIGEIVTHYLRTQNLENRAL